ncbi:LysR family transcriptional regulator [Cupriavidus cauae]|uniref:LysR family transcriptional regulator n=1 Tax=Cupriavidus cauae TaxID=2608999 RepID=UPI002242F30F|nr:LysR substrate-binding domain-containing protein [Cupriavidus cauae]UZN48115.1 LysR family transcriptional regulator [Cupriavidus cauae]
MHARVLRYLDEVVRRGSIRKAAEALHVAPTAINRQILDLEAELGAPLFERIQRRLRLTPLGEMVLAHVRQTLREHDALRERIAAYNAGQQGIVTVATTAGLAGSLLPALVHDFRRRHPGIAVRVLDLPVAEIVAALAECVGYPLILPVATMSIRGLLDDAFVRAAIPVPAAVEAGSTVLMRRLVMLGAGIALLNPLDAIEELEAGTLVFVPLRDPALPLQRLTLFARARGSLDSAASLMAERIGAALKALSGGGAGH